MKAFTRSVRRAAFARKERGSWVAGSAGFFDPLDGLDVTHASEATSLPSGKVIGVEEDEGKRGVGFSTFEVATCSAK